MVERPNRCLLCEARYSNPVCQMDAASLSHFASLTLLDSYDPGQKLFSQGDPPTDVFLIRSGQVKLVHTHPDGAEQILRTAGAGETLGIGASPETGMIVSAVATASTHVCRLPMSRVEDLLARDPQFSMAWMHLLSDEIRRSREAILNLGPQAAAQRLASYLLKACREGGRNRRSPEIRPGIRTTHADLAATLSIAPETTTRLLGALADAGIVKLSRGRIDVLDVDRLAALCEFSGSRLASA